MFCLKTRKIKNIHLSTFHKWAIYLIGLSETLLFAACFFGWVPLVYVLKKEEIFLHLCQKENLTAFSNISHVSTNDACPEQDQAFALVFTTGTVVFGVNSVIAAYLLYYMGLVITRIISGSFLILGFVALGLLNKEETFWLYISTVLITMGGNMLRYSGYQFCNLFPKWRSTALAVISGSFTASNGLFLIFQIAHDNGVSLWRMSLVMAFVSFLSVMATIIMPWNQIQLDKKEKHTDMKVPFRTSIFSISYFVFFFWYFLIAVTNRFYTIYFNSWTSKISTGSDEVAFYSLLFSIGAFITPVITPLPGIFNDYLLQKAKSSSTNRVVVFQKEVKVPSYTLALLLLMAMATPACLFFNNYKAIYISIALCFSVRSWLLSIGNNFIRIRFPPEHFERMIGINSAFASLGMPLLYPLFVWSQYSKIEAMSTQIVLLFMTLVLPLHLLSKKYRKKISEERYRGFQKEQEIFVDHDQEEQPNKL